MIMHDWNSDKNSIILLIHPMFSWANGMKVCIADNMGDGYRYLAPDLSAHGDSINATYKSAAEEAEKIHEYLLAHGASHLKMAYGASLGGVVLLQLLKYDDISFDHIFFEGTSFYKYSKLLVRIVLSVFLKKHKKAVQDPELSRKKMAERFGDAGADILADHFIRMNEESITNIVHDCDRIDLPELSEDIQKKSVFAYGDKDTYYKKAKKMQPKTYPAAKLEVWPGYGHCGKLSKDSKNYSDMLKKIAQS